VFAEIAAAVYTAAQSAWSTVAATHSTSAAKKFFDKDQGKTLAFS
jgi:hypothetical protein